MKKHVKKLIICCVCLLSFGNNVLLYAVNENTVPYGKENLNDSIVIPTVNINGNNEKLYKEFEYPNKAFNKLVLTNKSFLNELSEKYNLEHITLKNWKQYQNIVKRLYNDNYSNDIYKNLVLFFDVFENKEKNDLIKEKIYKKDYNQLEYLMPSNSSYVESKLGQSENLDTLDAQNMINIKEMGISMKSTNLPNMTVAINYAEKYAVNPNTGSYHYFSNGDCANFVSQILEAGGIRQEVYNDRSKGWWHTRGNWHIPFLGSEHKHSEAWSMADTFVRYMGISSVTTNHYNFSLKINRGTIIAADFDSDGDWDHVAFVVASDNYSSNYSGKTYYDYKVAQHTSNYLEWTSSAKNGWENMSGRYAIVRQ